MKWSKVDISNFIFLVFFKDLPVDMLNKAIGDVEWPFDQKEHFLKSQLMLYYQNTLTPLYLLSYTM